MFKFIKPKRQKIFEIEKNNKFADRVIFLSIPAGLVFIMLVSLGIIPPLLAIISYITIIIFNIAFLFPLTFEMQVLRKHIIKLAKGEEIDPEEMKLSEQEAKEIADAVNDMHKFWSEKNQELQAQTISDTAVLDSLPDPIMMIDRQGKIVGANLASYNLFDSSIIDKNVSRLFDSINFMSAVDNVLSQESESENLIFYIKKPKQKKLYAHIKQLPWISKGKTVAVISLYDLTKAMRIEKMQTDFVANASHELRTPLSVISGCVETLQTTAKNDAKAREMFLNVMSDQTIFMSSLIENLLSLSKIELSQDEIPNEKVSISKLIDDVINGLSMKADDREIDLIKDIDRGVPTIIADSNQIKQIIQNLVDNAIKYGLSQTAVKIEVSKVDKIPPSKSFNIAQGEALAISINNQGPKISPENLSRITEKFYRLQEHKNLNIKGTGLGLSIAKHIILRHRGNLTVTSTSYDGTTFIIYLPIKQ